MKNIIILGSNGMAGHLISNELESNDKFMVTRVARTNSDFNIDFRDSLKLESLKYLLNKADVVINCVGLLIKQSEENIKDSIFINSYFPHFVSENCSRLIHLSTDCVFNGQNGPYNEYSYKNGETIYSKTKSLGEIDNSKDLTLRLSIIGPELKNGSGLFNWIFKQKKINGYTNHYWNGITTLELSKAIKEIISSKICGIYHLSNVENISKYNLIKLIIETFNLNIELNEFKDKYDINKVLINNRKDFNFNITSYKEQIHDLEKYIKNNKIYGENNALF